MEELEPEDFVGFIPLLVDLPYEEWVKHVFDHPVDRKEPWYWANDAPFWDSDADPKRTLEYVTRLFETSGELPKTYSFDQIGDGFGYLVASAATTYMFVFHDEGLPIQERVAGIEAMIHVFRDLFDRHLGAGGEALTGSSFGMICDMWWDSIPISCGRLGPEIDRAILSVLKGTLALPSYSCRFAALHGLGHNHRGARQATQEIIDAFLARHSNLPEDLVEYAARARTGHVL